MRSQKTSYTPIIAALFLILFLATVDNQLLIPLLPDLESDLDVPVARLGILFSVYALAAAFFNLVLGPWTDRLGRVPFLIAGLALYVLSASLTSLSSSFTSLLALRAMSGLSGGLISNCVASFVGDFFPYQRRGRVMGIVLSAYFVALILGIPLSVSVAEAWGWRVVFRGTALLALVLLAWVVFFFPSDRKRQTTAPILATYRDLLSDRGRRGALATSFLVSGATLAFLTFISQMGLTPGQVSRLFLVSGLAAIAGSPFAGWWSDRWGKRGVFLTSSTLLMVAMVLLIDQAWGTTLFVLFFLLMLLGAARQTSLQTLQTALVEGGQRGAFIGLRNGVSQLGISVCVLVAGQILPVAGYSGVILFAVALTVVATLIFMVSVPEPQE